MSMLADFGFDEWEAPELDESYYEEEDVLIAEVTHACCGRVQSYWNCSGEDVPGPQMICRDCLPRVERSPDEFDDPFAGG